MSATVVPSRPCHHVVVAVPARNEQATIADSLASIDRAATRVSAPVTISLAADTCRDDTLDVARAVPLRRARLIVVEGEWGRAGAARAAAVAHALHRLDRDTACWIANTDADCRVPVDWLEIQLHHGRAAAAVAGIVALDPATTPAHLLSAFHRTYHVDGNRHHHVHGANLGVWADAYTAAGGWCTRRVVGEDHALWDAVRAGGHAVTQTATLRVVTSARTRGRVHGGFATNLFLLDEAPSATIGRPHDPDPTVRADPLTTAPPAA